jgi:hypothetical protein
MFALTFLVLELTFVSSAYTMNINGQNALCYLRQVYCAQGDDPEAPLPETNVYFASRNFFPGTPQGKMALRLLFEAAKVGYIVPCLHGYC